MCPAFQLIDGKKVICACAKIMLLSCKSVTGANYSRLIFGIPQIQIVPQQLHNER